MTFFFIKMHVVLTNLNNMYLDIVFYCSTRVLRSIQYNKTLSNRSKRSSVVFCITVYLMLCRYQNVGDTIPTHNKYMEHTMVSWKPGLEFPSIQ